MRERQVFNPYLPPDVYIPDGEPHVFGDRLYIYGSHDQEGGESFCLLDYEVWSAPLKDLTNWRCEGISYRTEQDPDRGDVYRAMYAPDVVQGNDGRYYLYYAMSGKCFTGPFHVAVSDSPAGPFSYYGEVHHPDGQAFRSKITFDPAVINDDGVIRLYYGWSLAMPQKNFLAAAGTRQLQEKLYEAQINMFEKTPRELAKGTAMGAYTVVLSDDMLTVRTAPVCIVPGQFDSLGTSFEGHAFFEASSIRKIDGLYYFIYSSQLLHELCYATSRYPDREYTFRGTLISNGDIGFEGRTEPLAMTGNDHGSLAYADGEWYIFYHRHTHGTSFSRQGCAERLWRLPDGSFSQAQMTSCGLNGGPLRAAGSYPALIACNLTNGRMPQISDDHSEDDIPQITHEGDVRYITNISDGTLIGYKYFAFTGETLLTLTIRGNARGEYEVCLDDVRAGTVAVTPSADWTRVQIPLAQTGTHALYLRYHGDGRTDLWQLAFFEE